MIEHDTIMQVGANERPCIFEHEQPLVTYAVFAFNQEKTITAAIKSALAQNWRNLEIILSDDCSTDSTFDIMKRIYGEYHGQHKIILNRNSTNLGIAHHVNAVMELTHGDLIIAAAGDDVSDSSRTAELVKAWVRTGYAAAVFHSGFNSIDSDGRITHVSTRPKLIKPRIEDLIFNNVAKGATQAWSRKIFDFFGPLSTSLCQEDMNITMRGAMLGGVHYVSKPLVSWHTGGMSNSTSTSQREARRRNSIWYSCDMAQAILDLHTAMRRAIIDQERYNSLVTMAGDRLMFEMLLHNHRAAPFLRAALVDILKSYRRTIGAAYKLILLWINSRSGADHDRF